MASTFIILWINYLTFLWCSDFISCILLYFLKSFYEMSLIYIQYQIILYQMDFKIIVAKSRRRRETSQILRAVSLRSVWILGLELHPGSLMEDKCPITRPPCAFCPDAPGRNWIKSGTTKPWHDMLIKDAHLHHQEQFNVLWKNIQP